MVYAVTCMTIIRHPIRFRLRDSNLLEPFRGSISSGYLSSMPYLCVLIACSKIILVHPFSSEFQCLRLGAQSNQEQHQVPGLKSIHSAEAREEEEQSAKIGPH